MKKLQRIELPKMDLHPDHRLSSEDMGLIHGGAGCICNKRPFNLNGGCACNKKKFGICKDVEGGGSPEQPGCTVNIY